MTKEKSVSFVPSHCCIYAMELRDTVRFSYSNLVECLAPSSYRSTICLLSEAPRLFIVVIYYTSYILFRCDLFRCCVHVYPNIVCRVVCESGTGLLCR